MVSKQTNMLICLLNTSIQYNQETRYAVLADGGSGLSSNCIGDYTETWTPVPGAAKGSVALPLIFTVD